MTDRDQDAALPERIYHVTFASDWAAAQEHGEYRLSTRGARLDDVGFIHASHAHQVRPIGRSHYLDATESVVVLVIDPTRVQSAVKVERVGAGTEQFPHIYGPLDISAVVDVLPATVERGEFLVERLPLVNFDQGLPDPAHFPVALAASNAWSRRSRTTARPRSPTTAGAGPRRCSTGISGCGNSSRRG